MRTAEIRDFLQYGPKFLIFHQNDDFLPESRRSHRALGMSDFDACATVGKEIVLIFHFSTSQGRHNYVHTCRTQKAHRSILLLFDDFCCQVCLMCALRMCLVSAHNFIILPS